MTTEEELIPTEFWFSLDTQPQCLTLRSAIADRLEELGDSVASECIRWTVDNDRVPYSGCWHSSTAYGDKVTLPTSLWLSGAEAEGDIPHLFGTNLASVAYRRLIWRWKQGTPEERAEWLKWTPAEATK